MAGSVLRFRVVAVAIVALVVGSSVFSFPAGAASAIGIAASCKPGSGVDLSHRTLTPKELSRKAGPCADLGDSRLVAVDAGQADLTGWNLRGAVFTDGSLSQATLSHADLTDANVSGTNLSQATLTGTVLTGIRAVGTNFEQDDLHGLSLTHADLHDADLEQTNLDGADLAGADLSGASLDQADLTHANLTGANLQNTNLDEVTGLDTATGAGNLQGTFPIDALAAIITFLLACAALRPRLRRHASGRPVAVAVLGLFGVLAIGEIITGLSWHPTTDDAFLLPMITPVVFIALFVGRSIRLPRNGWAATALGFLDLLAFLLLIDAGLAYLADDLFGTIPLLDACRTAACAGGAARGTPTILAAAIAVILLSSLLRLLASRQPPTTRTGPTPGSLDGSAEPPRWTPPAPYPSEGPGTERPPSQTI